MIKSLQSLRFVFALLIFMHHSALGLSAFGAFPVSFFLILSGFVLMMSYGERVLNMNYFEFIQKRFVRIYPTHLLCLVVALITCIFISKPIVWHNTWPSFFMLQAWIPNKEVYFAGNSVSWYVSVVFFCYLMFPFLVRIMKRHPTIVMLTVVLLYLSACFIVPDAKQHALLYINPIARIADFIIGMWLYMLIGSKTGIQDRIEKLSEGGGKFVMEAVGLMVCVAFVLLSLHNDNPFMQAAIWWIPSIVVISIFYFMENTPGPISKILQNKFFVTLGSISFAFYLLHISILVINNYLMTLHPINYVLDGILVLSITTILAYIITYYYEPLFKKTIVR